VKLLLLVVILVLFFVFCALVTFCVQSLRRSTDGEP
jgi:hypothetical protein